MTHHLGQDWFWSVQSELVSTRSYPMPLCFYPSTTGTPPTGVTQGVYYSCLLSEIRSYLIPLCFYPSTTGTPPTGSSALSSFFLISSSEWVPYLTGEIVSVSSGLNENRCLSSLAINWDNTLLQIAHSNNLDRTEGECVGAKKTSRMEEALLDDFRSQCIALQWKTNTRYMAQSKSARLV